MIPGAYLIMPLLFEEAQKAPYPFTCQICQIKVSEFAVGIIGYEQQK
jgi:hypothetical protein